MKIAYVVPGGVDRSGTQRVIPHLVERFGRLARDHEVHVFALRQEPSPGRWKLDGAHVHNIGARPRRLRCLAALRREHARRPFDIVHAVFVIPQGVVASLFGRWSGVPVVVEEPGGAFASLPEVAWGGWGRWQGRAWIDLAMRGADRLLVPSEFARDHGRSRGFEALVVPWGTDRAVWPECQPRPRERDVPMRVGWVGSLNRVKDPETMLRVADALKRKRVSFHLDVYGEDTLQGRIQRMATEMDLSEHVTFRGFRPQSELVEAVTRMDVLLVTSRFEGTPRVVHEAAIRGVPTVGTAVGVLATIAPSAAATAPVGDASKLAEHLATWAHDDSQRLRAGSNALAWAAENDLDRCLTALRGVYEPLVGGTTASATAVGGPR